MICAWGWHADARRRANGSINKRGTLTDDVLIVGDVALIERGEKWYFAGVFAYQTPEGLPQTTYEALEAGMTDFGALFCQFLGAGR